LSSQKYQISASGDSKTKQHIIGIKYKKKSNIGTKYKNVYLWRTKKMHIYKDYNKKMYYLVFDIKLTYFEQLK